MAVIIFILEHSVFRDSLASEAIRTQGSFFFFFINLFILFIFGCVGSSLLCTGFSSCGEWGLLFVAVRGLLIAVASLVAEHGL